VSTEQAVVQPAATRRGCGLFFFGLIIGLLAGAGGVAWWAADFLRKSARAPESAWDPAELLLRRLERQIIEEIALTPDQRRTISEEMGFTIAAARDIRLGLSRSTRRLAEDTLERIARRLPADKEARLREVMRRRLGPWGLLEPLPEKSTKPQPTNRARTPPTN